MYLFDDLPNSSSTSSFNESINSFSSSRSSSRILKTSTRKFAPGLNAPPLRSIRDQMIMYKREKKAADAAASSSTNHFPPLSPPKDEEKDFWVTVFGFDKPQDADSIIALFGRHGHIVKISRPAQGGKAGNWVHLRYATKVHVQQALLRNGEYINNHFIGVLQSPHISYDKLDTDDGEDCSMFDESVPDENFHNTSSHLKPKPTPTANMRSCAAQMPEPPKKSFMERFFG